MSNALAQLPTQIPVYTDIGSVALPNEIVRRLTSQSKFLGRLQLFQGGSEVCKTGLIQPGHWGIPVNKAVEDLGNEIEVMIFQYRTKALDVSNSEKILVSYEPESDLFKAIEERAGIQDSNCMAGLEFLVWERSLLRWLTYFAYTGSAQFIAEQLIPVNGPLQLGLGSEFVTRKKKTFHAPVVRKSTTPFPAYPTEADVKVQIETFLNPDKGDEKSEDTPAAKAAAVSGRKR